MSTSGSRRKTIFRIDFLAEPLDRELACILSSQEVGSFTSGFIKRYEIL